MAVGKNPKVFQTPIDAVGGFFVNGTQVIDADGNIDAPITTTNATFSGNTTIGDASADTCTINATTQANAPVTVGVNDTGHDVKFFGATAGKSWLWDESADTMIVTGSSTLGGATQSNGTVTVGVDDTGYDVKFFGATTGKSWLWDESADTMIVTGSSTLGGTTQVNGTVSVGVNDTGYDVTFFGATAGKSWLWDESADKMIVTGDAQITGVLSTANTDIGTGGAASCRLLSDLAYAAGFGVIGSGAATYAAMYVADAPQTITAGTGGAISVTTHMTDISTDAGGDAFTLASGVDQGQMKKIILTVDGGGDAVITATFSTGNNTLTMADAGDYALLQWTGTAWAPVELGNTIDGITRPVLSTV